MNLLNLVAAAHPEEALLQYSLSEEERRHILEMLPNYDEYYLFKSGNVTIFHQAFIKDAYMDLAPIERIRLVQYPLNIALQDLQEIVEVSDLPIISRVHEKRLKSFQGLGFQTINNLQGEPIRLLPISFHLPRKLPQKIDSHIRPMQESDLQEIEEILKNEYSLRYRMVNMMFHDCPEACLVYEDKGKIAGMTFNMFEECSIYMRQIFVCEGFREKNIARKLYTARLKIAKRKNLVFAHGHMRPEAGGLHFRYRPAIGEHCEYYVIRR